MVWADVITGSARWSVECTDCLDFLRALPDDSVDMLFTSPPYELARTYGIGERMVGGQEWVDWMVEVVRAAAPKVKGLIAVNCEGQTRDYSYSGVPFLLFADLKRAGFNMRKPPIFHRVGIPGSGGPDWLRNDYEPVLCVTRRGRLPWSDNTACGHPPKWEPGGKLSYRDANGKRRHKIRGTSGYSNGDAREFRASENRLLDRAVTEIANPGNVITLNSGGGHMGHPLGHDNEAPFPVELPAFFVKSFCPPGGIVCDPFAGSGTTCHAALDHGRRFVGCDVRESQVELCRRRMATVTPSMFSEADP